MSYDIRLKDPVSGETIELDDAHFMRGGTYAIGGTRELWLNITYNYASYYYDATENDSRFAHADGDETKYGIRGIYGKTGLESVPMLLDMISRIEGKYKKDGEWISTEHKKCRCVDKFGKEIDLYKAIHDHIEHTMEDYTEMVNEGPDEDYWEPTAGNAIKPLHQLIAMAKMRPDGIWDGD